MQAFVEVLNVPGDERTAVASADELIIALQAIAVRCREKPPLVTVVRKDGDTLSIGLGKEYSALSFVGANQDPPYFISVGSVNPHENVVFYFNGHYTEFPPHSAVTVVQGFETMRSFVAATGMPLPSNVSWEEV